MSVFVLLHYAFLHKASCVRHMRKQKRILSCHSSSLTTIREPPDGFVQTYSVQADRGLLWRPGVSTDVWRLPAASSGPQL